MSTTWSSAADPMSGHRAPADPAYEQRTPRIDELQVLQEAQDAVPKKRGPKTDVLEALLKRVDGLEARLKDQNKDGSSPTSDEPPSATTEESSSGPGGLTTASTGGTTSEPKPKRPALDTARATEAPTESAVYTPVVPSEPSPGVQADALLDTYFSRFHAKPYHILDESSVRQRLQLNQVPDYLVHAVYAVAAR
ncbi:hypothetical protein SLS62_010899 [Diatrype stigma]|uniref:Uncharacterized protein n=1 Tax=Diatrype stigma TaxID=117547 RepID=A0AAN9UEE4_9PEZI